ncbi:hypothetical protein ACTXI9_01710 [Brachybacterium alimentarium]|uniref:hypothetical protein n=1 Tax=Brachybacterium alimentarium TaxID=47845 RepID=UPI003FD6B057
MKRAEVFYNHWGDQEVNGRWLVATHDGEIPDRHLRLKLRESEEDRGFRTHAAALAHALAEVGLTKKTGDES